MSLDTSSQEFRSALKFSSLNFVAIAIFIVGGFVDGDVRVACWIVTISLLIISTILAGKSDWIVRTGHFAERHGLILIIALGEVIVAMGISVVQGTREEGLATDVLVGLTAAGVLAGLMWWSYFDRVLPALEHRGETLEGRKLSRYTRDVYTYCHAPIILGIIAAAAALEEALLHPADPLHEKFRVILAAGAALYFVGVAATIFRAYEIIARERLLGLAAIVALCIFSSNLSAIWLIIGLDLILIAVLVAEHLRLERKTTIAL